MSLTAVFKEGKQEDAGDYSPASLTLILMKVMEQVILETISRHVEDKAAIRSSRLA